MTRKDHSNQVSTRSQVTAFRLARHHLTERSRAGLVTVCQDVCGIQAQVMAAAEMALWARVHDLTREEIKTALWRKRTLVKTSCMRQTLHLIPARDFSIYITALRRSRVEALMRIMTKFGLTRKEFEAMNQAVVDALSAGPRTKPELTGQIKSQVGKRVRDWMERVWSVFRPALAEGLICYGPDRGPEVTFVRVDHWLPNQRIVAELEAQQVLLRRYLGAYGPATLQDFSKWTGIPIQEGRKVWELLGGELAEVSIDGDKAWMLRKDKECLATSSLDPTFLRLLPSFDSYMLGHVGKKHLVDDTYYNESIATKDGSPRSYYSTEGSSARGLITCEERGCLLKQNPLRSFPRLFSPR